MKFECKSSDLFRVMSDALQFASAPIGVPAIEAVRIETTPNDAETVNLIGVATDRFVLGVSRVIASGDAGVGFTLATADVKNVLRIAKTSKRDAGWRRVTAEVDADAGRISFLFSSGEQVTVKAMSDDFPSWRQLLIANPDAMARPAGGLGVDPLKLATFSRVAAAKESPMRMFPGVDDVGRLKPVHIIIGDDFYGLVMPVRAPADSGSQLFAHGTPGWLS